MLGVLRPSSAATQQKQDAERREREGVDLRGSTNGHSGPPPKIIWFRPTDKRVPLIAIRKSISLFFDSSAARLPFVVLQPPNKHRQISSKNPKSIRIDSSSPASSVGRYPPFILSDNSSKN
jgi:hypothetical protein